MRLQLARPRPLAEFLQGLKHENANQGGASRRSHGGESLRAPIDEQHDPQPVPKPAIAHSCSQNHPQPHPPWGSPAVHPAHYTVIAPFDVSPESACDSHRFNLLAQIGLEARVQIPEHALALFAPFQSASPFLAKENLVEPMACRKSRDQHRKRHKCQSPRFFHPQGPHYAEDVCC
jgi:hypothetical protein